MGWRRQAMICSAVLIIIGIASLAIRGLNWGIEFTGGTLVEVAYQDPVQITDIRAIGDDWRITAKVLSSS